MISTNIPGCKRPLREGDFVTMSSGLEYQISEIDAVGELAYVISPKGIKATMSELTLMLHTKGVRLLSDDKTTTREIPLIDEDGDHIRYRKPRNIHL